MGDGEYLKANGFIAEVVRTKRRKTASVRVDEQVVSVVVPMDLPQPKIAALLKDKERWIKNKIREQKNIQPVVPKQFVSGEAFSYLGRNYRLKVKRGPFTPVKLVQGRLVATLPDGPDNPQMVRNALVRWYRAQAKPKMIEKTARYADSIGVEAADVGIKSYKARWGSCSSTGRIDYNWRIVMAPHAIVDYVVVHELCHLKHFNHSSDFWKQVRRIMPECDEHRDWLRKNGRRLLL